MFNRFVKYAMSTCNWDMTYKLSYLEEKRLLIGTVCFNTLDTLDFRTERST